jgi:hypothetical protein
MDWSINFKWQYDYAKKQLQNLNNYDADWQSTIQALKDLLDPGGFDRTKASALDTLRTKAHQAGGKRVSIDLGLLNAVNAFNDGAAVVSDAAKLRASALKFLTHVYLLHTSGKRSLWIHSLPNEFLHWPSIHFNSWVSTDAALKDLLKSNREHFSEAHKKDLASAAQYALAWCHKTNMILAQAASKSDKGKDGALAIVKRWFADPATTEADLNKYIATLSAGFKSITATLSKGSMILTDWVPLRSASTEEEIRFLNSEAFTFASRYEGLDVVYIEKSFFVDHPGNVLKGSKNWTRILVHELTHLVCGTEDVTRGQARYAWYGIGPHAGFPGSDAVRNADSWAFFCTDCAGLLTDGERNQALKIV